MDFLKADALSNSKWRVLAIPFGGPFKGGKDLDGEFFSANTDIKAEWFDRRPVIFHHGRDATIKDADLGVQELDREPDADGWWSTVWLNRASRYWDMVNGLLRAGKAYGSSGAISHLVKIDRASGEILVWPHAEQTLTPTPINFLSVVRPAKALDHFETAGIDLDETVKASLLADGAGDLPTDLPGPAAADAAATGGEGAASGRIGLVYARYVLTERRFRT